MRRYSNPGRGRRTSLALALAFVLSLVVGTSGAQAVVVTDAGSVFGVALVPGTRANLTASTPAVTSNAPCSDPSLSPEFTVPATALCARGGPVLHKSETFALVWDPNTHRHYAAPYVEQFLRDVADGHGTLTSPYAVTTQYADAGGRAANDSLYGGGRDDASNYPTNDCTPSGIHHYSASGNVYTDVANDVCLTDATLKSKLVAMVQQNGLLNRIQPGYSPLLVLLTPPGVETCLDAAGHLCSANSDSTVVPAQFCSYHSQVSVSGTVFEYVVQPWTTQTNCDEPDAPKFTTPIDPQTLATDMGIRLVSPLSQGQIAAIVNPALNGWVAHDGSEINDNGCSPIDKNLDSVTVGASGQNPYLLQREANNGGAAVNDPFALPCAPSVVLAANFVVPSAVDRGDVVEFDGSKTRSTLLVLHDNYAWNFGDGATATGPSVVHSYATAGNYNVSLHVTDRGNNMFTLNQAISVLGPTGVLVAPPSTHPSPGLRARLQLVPESLRSVLRSGVAVRVSSNQVADAVASVSITRSAAKRAHIRFGHGPSVVIGRGTVSGIKNGTIRLHLRLSRATVAKLKHLSHVTLTIRMALVAAGRAHVAVVVAGRY